MTSKGARRGLGTIAFDERTQLWVGRIDLPRGPDGKRRRKRVTSRNREAMLDKLRDAQGMVARGETIPTVTERWTVEAWLHHWVEHVAPRSAPKALDDYRRIVAVHLVPRLGHHRLRALAPEHVEQMVADLEDAGLSPGRVTKIRMVLGRSLEVALKRGHVDRNVVRLTDAPTQPAPHVDDALSEDDVERVLDHARGDRLEALAVVALALGLRQGELVDLRWSDVNIKARTLTVRRAKTRAGVRSVPLPTFVVEALQAHHARQRVEIIAADIWGDRDVVFATTVGTKLGRRNLLRWWHALTIDAGVGRRRFHASRHTAATVMLNRGVDLATISKILGHSRINVTHDTYARAGAELLRSAADVLDVIYADR